MKARAEVGVWSNAAERFEHSTRRIGAERDLHTIVTRAAEQERERLRQEQLSERAVGEVHAARRALEAAAAAIPFGVEVLSKEVLLGASP